MLNIYGWQEEFEFAHASFDKLIFSCRIIGAFTHHTWILLCAFLSHSLVNAWFQAAMGYLRKKIKDFKVLNWTILFMCFELWWPTIGFFFLTTSLVESPKKQVHWKQRVIVLVSSFSLTDVFQRGVPAHVGETTCLLKARCSHVRAPRISFSQGKVGPYLIVFRVAGWLICFIEKLFQFSSLVQWG